MLGKCLLFSFTLKGIRLQNYLHSMFHEQVHANNEDDNHNEREDRSGDVASEEIIRLKLLCYSESTELLVL